MWVNVCIRVCMYVFVFVYSFIRDSFDVQRRYAFTYFVDVGECHACICVLYCLCLYSMYLLNPQQPIVFSYDSESF